MPEATALTPLKTLLCCIIPFLTAPVGFYLSLVSMALFGQTYRESAALFEAQSGK